MSRTSAMLLAEIQRQERVRLAALNERRRALGLAPLKFDDDVAAPTSQHVDEDPERSMQEDRLDV